MAKKSAHAGSIGKYSRAKDEHRLLPIPPCSICVDCAYIQMERYRRQPVNSLGFLNGCDELPFITSIVDAGLLMK